MSFNDIFVPPRRVATASTRWIPTGRRPTPLSTTTSATPPIITHGVGSRRASPGPRRMATGSPTAWRSQSPDHSHLPFPPYLPSCPSRATPPPSLNKALAQGRAPCSGPRAAGLPPHRCCPPSPTVSTALSTGPPAVWAQPVRHLPRDSPLSFDPRLSFRSQQ